MRLGVINHHGREPAGSELTLMRYLDLLPPDIEPTMFLFEDGAFAEMCRRKYPTIMVPMSERMAGTTRSSFGLGSVLDAVSLTKRLTGALREQHIDVVLTNSVKAHFIGMVAARLQRLPCVLYLHDVLHGKALTILKALARMCSSTRVACSRLAANSLALDRTSVLYSPIDIDQFASLPDRSQARNALGIPDDGKPVVGLVGRIARWKGQDRFIRIAADVLARHDAHFVIIGAPLFGCDDSYPRELTELAERLGISDALHFLPWQNDLASVYASLDIACNCSEEEPFGRTILEAMASCVPVICFADAGVCETFADGVSGYQITFGDERVYAQRISELLSDAQKREAFGSHAREAAKHISTQALVPIFESSIRTAIKIDSKKPALV